MRLVQIGCVLALAMGAAHGVARADAPQPWAQGVTDAQKAKAQEFLDDGNKKFLAQDYKNALKAYEDAIGQWDHPAIRFNIVRCLIQLDRPVEASDNLQLALKYGPAPLEEAVYTEALSYQKLLANQIADVEISCNQVGAKVTLDSQVLITNCPGKEKRRVAPGQHGVVATKDGFMTKQLEIVVVGGKTEAVDVKLVPLAQAAKIVHRWPTWIPWVVFGGGLVVGGFGLAFELNAQSQMSDFDMSITSDCMNIGCNLDDPANASKKNQHDRAELNDKIAISVMSVGIATATVGGVLLFMNRGRTVYDDTPEKRGPLGTARLDYVPHQGGGVFTLSGRF